MKTWAKALEKPAIEFPKTDLPVISGSIPDGLRGSLYRNGPGRLERGGRKVGHWFDGDGTILAVHFTETGASAVYRYVKTSGYQRETEADRYLFPNYGMTAPGFFWNNWGKEVKNAANTSVLALEDRLLALWEGGFPHRLDLQTLETFGLDDLEGLRADEPFSAHPKIDPLTGEIFNFGVTPSAATRLNLYRSNANGTILQKNTFPLDGLSLLHDFVLAGQYLVFFVPPVRVDLLPMLFGFRSYSDAMKWKPNLGTRILIFDRSTLSLVRETITDPWFQWHFGNGRVTGSGTIEIAFVRYEDFQTNQYLKEVATGETRTPARGTLWRIEIDPRSGEVVSTEKLHDLGCDFPVVSPALVGRSWRYTALAVHRPDAIDTTSEILGLPAVYDHQTGDLSIVELEPDEYASEPIFVSDGSDPERGWLIAVVYNGNRHSSEVRIYNSPRPGEALCRLQLPSVIPPGFHGTWKGEKA
ncbi:carotenoid oxygenase family protein [Pannus brasiliensis CCIBt3594]|uniref:Carotenoid oxygenase family protein n=1 Tax=Pannus brasiliensis CCIBt3594 TaxID=1427578 RepID=A0AAW9QS98_9CHRO